MDTTVADPLVGRVLDGRYRIESRVARGGMATVYAARDIRLDRVVAIKVMHAHLAADDDFVRRFIGEAKAAAALSHPNVVAVYDQRTDGEHVFLVMEYVPGRTLRELLTERGRLGPRAALEVMQPVLAALGAAHRAGLVHRDVKPENVLITEDGQVKVADFGLARAESDSKMTKTGLIIGTVGYLAPEQVLSGNADVRSDVYAAGVLLYELLTGELPHQGESPLAVAYKHVNEVVPPPSDLVPGLPRPVDELVAAATAHDPARRPQDANQFLAAAAEVNGGFPADIDQRVEAAGYTATSVLETPAMAPADGHTRVFDGRTGPHGPYGGPGHPTGPEDLPPHRSGGDRLIGALTGRYVLIAIGTVAAVVLGWAVWWQVSGQYEVVPERIVGMKVAAAERELTGKGLVVRRYPTQEFSNRARRGEVARTDPPAGARVAQNQTITLVVSKGLTPKEVPDVTGKPREEALKQLRDRGFTVGRVSEEPSQSTPKGEVKSTNPEGGEKHSPDLPVNVVVSTGMSMPDLKGGNGEDAENRLRGMGLDVKIEKREDGSRQPGTVIGQDPAPGTGVSRGDKVTLVVNKKDCLFGDFFCDDGPRGGGQDQQQLPVPTVLGRSFDEARRMLESSGFKVKVGSRVGDRVVGQSRFGNAPRDTEITIWG
ncbi:Stk1 family PASTA domain-containing Ser/Thr kinase [Actinomadura hibisca]|uniref:Stk1 family PASTA domain-containing Ser/Thr kinase n=1 Tax=Actinomadura hibisca TaxID=68565 RepID=UPI00083190A7|nr:Stk1 family PASTA domain-containing Ser/Thr kinase [Actinomadura hibisca]